MVALGSSSGFWGFEGAFLGAAVVAEEGCEREGDCAREALAEGGAVGAEGVSWVLVWCGIGSGGPLRAVAVVVDMVCVIVQNALCSAEACDTERFYKYGSG